MTFSNGTETVSAYLARPASPAPSRAVLVAHGNAGLPEDMCNAAAQLAQAGFVGLLLDPTSRTADPQSLSREFLMSYRYLKLLLSDLHAAVEYVYRLPFVSPDGVGLLGFCGGGILQVMFAAQRADIQAIVAFYAAPRTAPDVNSAVDPRPDMLSFVPQLSAPLQGHYGTADIYVPLDDVQELEDTLHRSRGVGEVYRYAGAAHGFYHYTYADDFNAEAATLAHRRMVAFFKHHLAP